jgi:hypothetical protein
MDWVGPTSLIFRSIIASTFSLRLEHCGLHVMPFNVGTIQSWHIALPQDLQMPTASFRGWLKQRMIVASQMD